MRRAKRRRRRGGQTVEMSRPNRPPRRFAPPLLSEEGNALYNPLTYSTRRRSCLYLTRELLRSF